MSAAFGPLAIMSIVAPLAAIDVLYFHIHKFRLHAHPSSQLETVTHLVRGALIAGGAYLLVRHEPRGSWFWVVTGLLVLDFLNNLADVILEPKSRARFGGLPPLEYVIHVVGATASGIVSATWVIVGWPLATLPTELAPAGDLPGWLAMNGYVLYIGAMAMTLGEGALLIRAMTRIPEPVR